MRGLRCAASGTTAAIPWSRSMRSRSLCFSAGGVPGCSSSEVRTNTPTTNRGRAAEATGFPCPQLLDRRWRSWRHRKRAALKTAFRSF